MKLRIPEIPIDYYSMSMPTDHPVATMGFGWKAMNSGKEEVPSSGISKSSLESGIDPMADLTWSDLKRGRSLVGRVSEGLTCLRHPVERVIERLSCLPATVDRLMSQPVALAGFAAIGLLTTMVLFPGTGERHANGSTLTMHPVDTTGIVEQGPDYSLWYLEQYREFIRVAEASLKESNPNFRGQSFIQAMDEIGYDVRFYPPNASPVSLQAGPDGLLLRHFPTSDPSLVINGMGAVYQDAHFPVYRIVTVTNRTGGMTEIYGLSGGYVVDDKEYFIWIRLGLATGKQIVASFITDPSFLEGVINPTPASTTKTYLPDLLNRVSASLEDPNWPPSGTGPVSPHLSPKP